MSAGVRGFQPSAQSDRPAPAPGLHRPRVSIARECEQLPTRSAAEHRNQGGLVQPRDLAHCRDALGQKLVGRDRADPPQPPYRKRMQELKLAIGWHDQKTVRLGNPARDLGEELRAGDADGDGQTDDLEHVAPQLRGDLGRRPRDPPQATHVEEGLVDRDALHERRRVREHLEHRLAGLAVGREPGRDDDRVGAEAARPPSAHRRAHPTGPRLIARREHHAAAHDDGAPAQPRVVALLDRRVERVEVSMHDGGGFGHEHMFARASDDGNRATLRCSCRRGLKFWIGNGR